MSMVITMILTGITIIETNHMGAAITDTGNQDIAQGKGTESRTTMNATNSVVVINQGTNIVTRMGKWYLKNVMTRENGTGMFTSVSNFCLWQSGVSLKSCITTPLENIFGFFIAEHMVSFCMLICIAVACIAIA